VRRKGPSTVVITLLESPLAWDFPEQRKAIHINHYYVDRHQNREFLERVVAIAQRKNGVLVEDGDYGTVPRYYLDLNIGQPAAKVVTMVQPEAGTEKIESHAAMYAAKPLAPAPKNRQELLEIARKQYQNA
jgi:hypothetical protein